eukprot:585501_1
MPTQVQSSHILIPIPPFIHKWRSTEDELKRPSSLSLIDIQFIVLSLLCMVYTHCFTVKIKGITNHHSKKTIDHYVAHGSRPYGRQTTEQISQMGRIIRISGVELHGSGLVTLTIIKHPVPTKIHYYDGSSPSNVQKRNPLTPSLPPPQTMTSMMRHRTRMPPNDYLLSKRVMIIFESIPHDL